MLLNAWMFSTVFVVCCVGSGLCDELIALSEDSCWVYMSNSMWSRDLNKEAAWARFGLLRHKKELCCTRYTEWGALDNIHLRNITEAAFSDQRNFYRPQLNLLILSNYNYNTRLINSVPYKHLKITSNRAIKKKSRVRITIRLTTGLLSSIHVGNTDSYLHYRVQTDCDPSNVAPETLSPIKRQRA